MISKTKASLFVGAIVIAGSALANNYGTSHSGHTDSTSGTVSGTSSAPVAAPAAPAAPAANETGTALGTKTMTAPAETASLNLREGVDYQVITFARGSADLTNAQKQSIKALRDSAKGSIDDIHVAVWSDQAFPANAKKDLPKAAQDLAERRSDAIENYLKYDLKESGFEVDTYNMAERSNWFARAFNTDDAELKSLFSQQGAPANVDETEFNVVRSKGGPMKAVILIEREIETESSLTPQAK